MLSIAHATTGAFIATHIPNPFLAAPLILTSHYLLDAIAHWDVGTGLSSGRKTPRQAFLHEIPDLFLTLLTLIWFFPPHLPLLSPANLTPYWGAFLALLPDFLEAPRNFLRREPAFLKPLNNFHAHFHHSIPHIIAGLLPQIILLTLIYLAR